MTKKDFQQLLARLEKIWFYFFDFDGNIAHTFLHVPNSNNNIIIEAYEYAVSAIWGLVRGTNILEDIGGLKNRAPGELIQAILEPDTMDTHKFLIAEAKKSFYGKFMGKPIIDRLSPCVPQGKGFPWVWDDENPEQIITEFLVREKLQTLLIKIGPHYPTPCPGFLHFYRCLQAHNQKNRNSIITGIISSGHEVFIRKTFEYWKVECPKLLLTDDDLRGAPGIDYVKTVKPNPVLVAMLYRQWLQSQGIELTPSQFQVFIDAAKARTIFYGDDPNKDGVLAANAGVRFGHFNPNLDPENVIEMTGGDFVFYDWRLIIEMLGL